MSANNSLNQLETSSSSSFSSDNSSIILFSMGESSSTPVSDSQCHLLNTILDDRAQQVESECAAQLLTDELDTQLAISAHQHVRTSDGRIVNCVQCYNKTKMICSFCVGQPGLCSVHCFDCYHHRSEHPDLYKLPVISPEALRIREGQRHPARIPAPVIRTPAPSGEPVAVAGPSGYIAPSKRAQDEELSSSHEGSSDPSYRPSEAYTTSGSTVSTISIHTSDAEFSITDYLADNVPVDDNEDHVLGKHHQLKWSGHYTLCNECVKRIRTNRSKYRYTYYICDTCLVPICSTSHLQLYHNRNGNPESSTPPVSSRTRSRRAGYQSNIPAVGFVQDEIETAMDFSSDLEIDLEVDRQRAMELDIHRQPGTRRGLRRPRPENSSSSEEETLPRRQRRRESSPRGGPSWAPHIVPDIVSYEDADSSDVPDDQLSSDVVPEIDSDSSD